MSGTTPNQEEGSRSDGEDHQDSPGDESDSTSLRRRTVLGGFAATGTAGALSGAGLYGIEAVLSDSELFGDGSAEEANSFRTGELDLGVAWESYYDPKSGERELVDSVGDCESGSVVDGTRAAIDLSDVQPGDSGSTEFCLQVAGNPGWLWVESTCPDRGLEQVLEASVSYDGGCDGDAELLIPASDDPVQELSGSLCEVLATLGNGVRLGTDCVDPDTTHCLTLDWAFPSQQYPEQYEEYEGTELTFALEFTAVQCRHNPDPTPPTEDGCQPDPCASSGSRIDRIAYCTEGGAPAADDISHEILQTTEDGAPTRVGWQSETPLSTVVLCYNGTEWPMIENFHVADGEESGTVSVGRGDERTRATLDDDQSLSDPAPDGERAITYVYDETTGTFDLDK